MAVELVCHSEVCPDESAQCTPDHALCVVGKAAPVSRGYSDVNHRLPIGVHLHWFDGRGAVVQL